MQTGALVAVTLQPADRRQFYEQFVEAPVLNHPPKEGPKEAIWRQTHLRCVVRFFEKTKTGMLRAPVFKGLLK